MSGSSWRESSCKCLRTSTGTFFSLTCFSFCKTLTLLNDKQTYIIWRVIQALKYCKLTSNLQGTVNGFLHYMNKRFEISAQNDELRKRIFKAYKYGYGSQLGKASIGSRNLETKLLRKMQDNLHPKETEDNEVCRL